MTPAIGNQLLDLVQTGDLADLGPGPRASAMPFATLNRTLDDLLTRGGFVGEPGDLIRALVLLWHDHLDASHTISQGIESADGSLLHGIMHRREPDYWNSKYWFRRVGNHAAFPGIAMSVSEMLTERDAGKLASQLWPHCTWNPSVFVEAVEPACGRAGTDEQRELLRAVQQVEFQVLLGFFLARE